jgi:hypothetical protein
MMKRLTFIAIALSVTVFGIGFGIHPVAAAELSASQKAALQAQIDTLKGTLMNLQARYAAQNATVAAPTTDLARLESGLVALQAVVFELRSRVEAGAMTPAARAAVAANLQGLSSGLVAMRDSLAGPVTVAVVPKPTVAGVSVGPSAAALTPTPTPAIPGPVPAPAPSEEVAPVAPVAESGDAKTDEAAETANTGPSGVLMGGIAFIAVIAAWLAWSEWQKRRAAPVKQGGNGAKPKQKHASGAIA